MPWYKGPTLLQLIDSIKMLKRKNNNMTLRIPIQTTYRITGVGTVAVGRIVSGTLKPGMQLCFSTLKDYNYAHTRNMNS